MNGLSPDRLPRIARRALLIGVAALVVAALAGLVRPAAFFYGYLTAFLFWSGVPLGAAAILMMHHLVGGRWGWSIRGPLEVAVSTLPLLVPLFLPVAAGVPQIFPWVQGAGLTGEQASPFRPMYLSLPFFFERAAAFLLLWAAGGWLLVRWSRVQAIGSSGGSPALQSLSGGGLVLYFLTVSFAGIDWIASLEPVWYSSVFGFYLIMGQALTALAVMVLLSAGLHHWFNLEQSISSDMLNDLGNLLLTFIVLHAYMAYSQFFIIWNGNLPRANTWYVSRMEGFWGGVSVLLIIMHFLLPFFALLFRRLKRDVRTLVILALVILAARVIEAPWMVIPAATSAQWLAALMAALALVGLGGIWLSVFTWQYRRAVARGPRPVLAQGS